MLGFRRLEEARGGDLAVRTAGLSLLLLDENKSGSVAPPTGPRAPPRLSAGGGLGEGLGATSDWGPRGLSLRLLLGRLSSKEARQGRAQMELFGF